MSIIIKKEDKEYHLFSVSHCWININSDCIMYFKHGLLKKLYGLKLDVEYKDLDAHNDFIEVDRILMYGKGDIVYYKPKSLKFDRLEKLKNIENVNITINNNIR